METDSRCRRSSWLFRDAGGFRRLSIALDLGRSDPYATGDARNDPDRDARKLHRVAMYTPSKAKHKKETPLVAKELRGD